MDGPTAPTATVGSTNLSNRPFVDLRGAPYLILLVWLVVLGVAFAVGLEYVGTIESDPDCSWDTCIQPFVGPLLWLLVGFVMTGGGYLAAVVAVALLEFTGPTGQRARCWVASVGPGLGVVGFFVLYAGAALT